MTRREKEVGLKKKKERKGKKKGRRTSWECQEEQRRLPQGALEEAQ